MGWGEYQITFKDTHITHRTTLFDENSILFCKRHRVVAGDPCPVGFRANWEDRGKLALAKLHSKLTADTTPSDYPGILLSQGTSTGDADFIEAHIYGELHRSAIERVSGPKPRNKADLAIWRSISRTLAELQITVVEY
jgi:hypothetical protein